MSITAEEFKQALPAKFHSQINQKTIDTINEVLVEPEMAEFYRSNFIDYSYILQEGKYTITDYVNAIKYCSFKIAGLTNRDAYIKTFPDRYKNHMSKGTSANAIDSYICAYNKTKLVTAILEQAYIPTWLLNQDAYQRAINVQLDLMMNADSEKVKSDAANSIMNHLKAPETSKIQLDIGLSGAKDTLDDLRKTMKDLASIQHTQIANGNVDAKTIAESKIIEHEAEEE